MVNRVTKPETKRDVFNGLLHLAQNLTDKDDEKFGENYRENITTPWCIAYDAALPDGVPVIPKAVGEYIKWCKPYRDISSISDAFYYAVDSTRDWIHHAVNSDIFARAWLLETWIVEETGEVVRL